MDEPEAHVEPVDGPEVQLCAKCKKLKPLRSFRRTLTQAQAEARGYFKHHIRPMVVPSKFCTECRPGHLRPSDLRHVPAQRLWDELGEKRVKPGLIEMELLRRARKQPVSARERSALGGTNRWEKFHADRWRYAKGLIRDELRRMTFQSRYYKDKLESPSGEYFGPNYRAILAFNEACSGALRELRAQATGFILRATISEDDLTWRDWVGKAKQDALRDMWMAMPAPPLKTGTRRPASFRDRLAMPLLLEHSDRRYVFHGCPVKKRYTQEDDAQERIQRAARTAAASAKKARGDDDEAQ